MKKFLKLFSVLLVAVMLTGCVKYNINMKITNDKKMKFEAIVAMQKSMMQGGQTSTDEDGINELKKKGFKVEEYKDDTYEGWKISKTYKNIDKYSSSKEVKVDLNKFLEGDEPEYFFQKKGNTYKAVFTFNLNQTENDATPNAEPADDTTTTGTDDSIELTTDGTDAGNDYFDSIDDEIDYSSLYSMMDIKYTVEVPKAGKNNATSTDKNKLTWDLTKMQNQDISFEFEVTGNNMIMYCAIAAAVLVLIIIIVVLTSKKKKPTDTVSVATAPTAPVQPEAPAQPEAPVEPTEAP